MRNRRLLIGLPVALIILAGLGCGGFSLSEPTPTPIPTETPAPTPTPIPTPTPEAAVLQEGWTLFEVEEEGFAIALPPNWEQIDVDPEELEASIDTVTEQNPELAGFLEGQASAMVAQGISFFGFDLSPETLSSDFMTNINIIVDTLDMEVTMDVLLEQTAPMLESLFELEQEVDQQVVTLSAGEAGRMQYGFDMAGPSGTVDVVVTQYVFLIDGSMYTLTFSTKADEIQAREAVFEQIADTFRLID